MRPLGPTKKHHHTHPLLCLTRPRSWCLVHRQSLTALWLPMILYPSLIKLFLCKGVTISRGPVKSATAWLPLALLAPTMPAKSSISTRLPALLLLAVRDPTRLIFTPPFIGRPSTSSSVEDDDDTQSSSISLAFNSSSALGAGAMSSSLDEALGRGRRCLRRIVAVTTRVLSSKSACFSRSSQLFTTCACHS